MNLDTIECVWTDKFHSDTLCVTAEIFESGKKKFMITKFLGTCGRGLILHLIYVHVVSCEIN